MLEKGAGKLFQMQGAVRNKDKLHLWYWQTLAMVAPGYGGAKPYRIGSFGLVLLRTSDRSCLTELCEC